MSQVNNSAETKYDENNNEQSVFAGRKLELLKQLTAGNSSK